jgi:hypothetical protein
VNALPQTFIEAREYFANPDQCLAYMVKKRWPNGLRCLRCGSPRLYFTASRKEWECRIRHPRRKFSLKTETVFQDSSLGFDKWLPVVWMVANRNHVSCLDVIRAADVTHRTAWFMLQRIRLAMQGDADAKTAAKED